MDAAQATNSLSLSEPKKTKEDAPVIWKTSLFYAGLDEKVMALDCAVCGRVFRTYRACLEHQKALNHVEKQYKCYRCPAVFVNYVDREYHMDVSRHLAFECSLQSCDSRFSSEEKKTQHEIKMHCWCSKCNRSFRSSNNIKMHLNSVTHLGTPVSCYFCQSKFTTATGLWHHLETSSCPKAPLFDRDTAYRLVHSWDPNHIITSKRLKWQGSTRHKANLSAWDGEHYACCFCYRKFNTLEALDQHLQSPKHQEKIYHCPNPDCRWEFSALASLCNHLESESCSFMSLKDVQTYFSAILTRNKIISL